MYNTLMACADNIKQKDKLSEVSVPREVLNLVLDSSSEDMAELLLVGSRSGVNFDSLNNKRVYKTPNEAFQGLKEAESVSEKMYSLLVFLSLFSPVTKDKVKQLLNLW